MSRIKVLRANPRRTLAALATLLIAVGLTAASGATFSAQSVNPSNTFSSGTMTHAQHEGRRRDPDRVEPEARRPGPDGRRRHQEHRLARRRVHASARTALPSTRTPAMAGQLNLSIDDCGTDLDCDDRPPARPSTAAPLAAMTEPARWAPGPPAAAHCTSSPSASTAPPATTSRARPPASASSGTPRRQPDRLLHETPDLMLARRVGRALVALLVTAGLLLGALLIAPSLLGWERYVLVSGSMTGTYDRGVARLRRGRPDQVAEGRRRDHLQAAARAPGPTTSSPTGSPRSAPTGSPANASTAPRATPTRSSTRGPSRCRTTEQARVKLGVPVRRLRPRGARRPHDPDADHRHPRRPHRAVRDGRPVARHRP